MKNNNKGFMMMETLIVATLVITTIIFLFVQLRNIINGYNMTFSYNTVNNLYATDNIKEFIKDDYDSLISGLNNSDTPYLNLSNCPNTYISETNYCNILFDNLKTKTVLFAKEDLSTLQSYVRLNQDLDQKLIDFILYINDITDNDYRLIVEFTDGTFATLKVKEVIK